MAVRRGYKQTDAGVIPEDWNCSSVAQIASNAKNSIVGGPFGSDLVSNDYVPTGIPVVRGQNMGGSYVSGDFVFVSKLKAKKLQANTARLDDIVLTQRGTLGQVSIIPSEPFGEYIISQSQMKLTLNPAVADTQYIYQYFSSIEGQKQITESAIQTGVPHTNLGILKAYRVPLPSSVVEQRAIAAALSDVDALLAKLDQFIAKKRDLKQAAMQQLLTGQTRLPGFSGEWEVKQLGGSCELVTKGTTPTSIGRSFTNVGVNFLKAESISESGKTIFDKVAFIDDATHRLLKRSQLMINDVLISIAGVLGRVGLIEESDLPANTNQALAVVRLGKESAVLRIFLFYCLRSTLIERQISDFNVQAAQANISLQNVRDLMIHLPPTKAEQTAIATVLSDMDAELAALEARRDKTRALKQGMMQELLTGRIRLV